MQLSPVTDRLMAEIRSQIPLIASESAGAREACVAFRNDEAGYEEWIKGHPLTGYVLHRDTSAAKVAYLHVARCPAVGGGDGMIYTKSPKVGCPTKAAAMQFALKKKWEVNSACSECPAPK